MKKIITNTILKKFIWTILLVMLVFQFCFPSLVFAEIEGDNYKNEYVADTYDNWIKVLPKDLIDDFDNEIIMRLRENYIDLNFMIIQYGVEFPKNFDEEQAANIIFEDRKKNGTLIITAKYSEDYNEINVEYRTIYMG